jgi:DNA-binding transcriptional MocR family regulator
MAKSPAFRSLSGSALKVFIEVRTRFHGGNNGDLSLSMDEAAQLLGIGKATAQRAFAELEAKGFLKMTRKGQWIGRLATIWRTTDKGCKGELPTNDWKAWQPRRLPPDVRPETEPKPEPGRPSPFRFKGRAA